MKFPIVIKQSPLLLIRRIIEVEALISVILFAASFLTNYEELYRSFTFGRIVRYDIILFVVASVLQLAVTVLVFFVWHSEEYRLKEKEIIHRKGFFGSREQSILLKNITSVEYKRSALEFLLGYGTIVLWRGENVKPFFIRSVDQAEAYTNLIKDAIDLALGRPRDISRKTPVLDLILEGENSTLEFKQTLRWDAKNGVSSKDLEKAVLKTIAAFLNTNGGTLLIGVTDKGTIHGLEEDFNSLVRKDRDGFENHVNQLIKNSIGAEFRQYIDVSFVAFDSKEVGVIDVLPSPKPVYVKLNGSEDFFIRTGNTTSPLKLSEVSSYIDSHWKK